MWKKREAYFYSSALENNVGCAMGKGRKSGEAEQSKARKANLKTFISGISRHDLFGDLWKERKKEI